MPGIRTYISLPAGISKMPLFSFLIYSAIGPIFWVSLLSGAGYIFGANYEQVGTYLKPISTIVLIGIFSAAIYWLIKRRVKSQK